MLFKIYMKNVPADHYLFVSGEIKVRIDLPPRLASAILTY